MTSASPYMDPITAATPSVYINGQWEVPSNGVAVPIINPATEEAIGEVSLGNASDVDRAAAAARAAFGPWSELPAAARAAYLEKMYALIMERAELFAQAISQEMGAAINFARVSQVPFAADHVRVAREILLDFPFVKVTDRTAIAREPIGVCALITPWNYPLYQITAKVAPALAAGCTVILKPSELSPLSGLLFARVVHDAGLPPGVFNFVLGKGEEVGHALAAHTDIDMISITGSNRAGVAVAQTAATTVKRVTQELGGKSPNILMPDADFAKAVPQSVMSAFRNVGQSCSAPTRMIVPRARLSEVEALAAKTAETIVVGDPQADDTILGPIANEAQYGRVQNLIAAGIADGAKLVCGGEGRPSGLTKGFYARPTVFSEVDPNMRIAQEEIFGPVLCIIPYDTVDEAVQIANNTVYGLGGYVQGEDLDAARAVARRIRSGQIHINHAARDPLAPFGGYKRSGNGREYGVQGFEEYLEVKSIVGYA